MSVGPRPPPPPLLMGTFLGYLGQLDCHRMTAIYSLFLFLHYIQLPVSLWALEAGHIMGHSLADLELAGKGVLFVFYHSLIYCFVDLKQKRKILWCSLQRPAGRYLPSWLSKSCCQQVLANVSAYKARHPSVYYTQQLVFATLKEPIACMEGWKCNHYSL